MRVSKRAQVSLEFLIIFGILMILLTYSIRNTSFSEGSPSVENLKIQVAIEEKALASAIANTISQVYAQGPGSKATSYVKLTYLKNAGYVERASGVGNPVVFITYCNETTYGPGVYVFVTNDTLPFEPLLSGDGKNVFVGRALYSKNLSANSTVWNPLFAIETNDATNYFMTSCGEGLGTVYRVYGISIGVDELPSTVKIVVEWNPDIGNSWLYNATSGELRINMNPGG